MISATALQQRFSTLTSVSNKMEGQSSQASGGYGGHEAPVMFLLSNNGHYVADLSLYENACTLDPKLQAFDTIIRERTSRALNNLSTGVRLGSISLDSLQELPLLLHDMDQEVVNVIMEDSKDILENQDMYLLVREYLGNGKTRLDFCSALINCSGRTINSLLIIQLAVNKFEEELRSQGTVDGKRFPKTLEELQNFKAAGQPFTEEFFTILNSFQNQQKSMFDELLLRKRNLDKKLKSAKTWQRVSSVLFVTAFVSVLIFEVVSNAEKSPRLVIAMAGALSAPIGLAGNWYNSLLNHYENELRGQWQLVRSMKFHAQVTIHDLDSMRLLVGKTEVVIESVSNKADLAANDEEAVILVMEDIKKQLEEFTGTVQMLKLQADKCIRDVVAARKVLLQKLMDNPGVTTSGNRHGTFEVQ